MLGETLGNYRVLRKLGEGGMGTVYLAEHTLIGRKVALKVLQSGLSQQEDILQRFFNEARATAGIIHPGVVQVLDYGQHTDSSVYLVMEYLRGEPLDRRLKRWRKLPIGEALRIAHHCASALAAAHAAGVIHRDLKPGNIFLVPDPQVEGGERAKILDFGIAKLTDDEKRMSQVKTRTGSMVGTPVYMSPEQCRGAGEIDHRSDIYALGCVLFRMICGRPPFVAEGVGDIIACHLREPPPSPMKLEPTVPPELDRAILQALAKSPEDRFADMAEMATTLKSLGRLPSIPPPADRDEVVLEPLVWDDEDARDDDSAAAAAHSDGDDTRDGHSKDRPNRDKPNKDQPSVTTRRLRGGTSEEEDAAAPLRSETTLGGVASQKLHVPRRARMGSMAAAAAAAVLLTALAVVLVQRMGDEAPAASPLDATATRGASDSAESPTPAPAPTGNAKPGHMHDTGPLVLPLLEAEMNQAPAADPADPAPAAIEVLIESRPLGAAVYQGEQRLGVTPYQYTAPSRRGQVTLTLRRRGYRTMSVMFPADRSDTISVAMVARKPPRQRRSGTRSGTRSGPADTTLDEELLSR